MNWTTFHQYIFPIRHKLYRFALSITGSVHEAEDVVQDILERAWKTSAKESTDMQNWEAWCMTMTYNRSVDKVRLVAIRRAAPIDQISDLHTDGVTPAQTLESSDLVAQIRRLMQSLPEKQRLVMHLRDIEELSYEEIAAVLDMNMDQVKVNLHRARKTMREKLSIPHSVTPVHR